MFIYSPITSSIYVLNILVWHTLIKLANMFPTDILDLSYSAQVGIMAMTTMLKACM